MPYPQRKSPRLQDYDYASSGGYFVTICTHQRQHLFGKVVDDAMVVNDWGRVVQDEWSRTAELRDYVELDAFVVMPNHIHGVIVIVSDDEGRGMMHHAPTTNPPREFGKPVARSLSTIVRAFKASVTRQINRMPNRPDHPIWQRNYYDHVIRDEPDLNRIREYVQSNPARWEMDSLYS